MSVDAGDGHFQHTLYDAFKKGYAMEILLWTLLIGFTAGSGVWYHHRAGLAQKRPSTRIGLAIVGSMLFVVVFFTANGIIDRNMPAWFYRFIMEYGYPAGYCLVMIGLACVNALVPIICLRDRGRRT
jgi:hypothetical protein